MTKEATKKRCDVCQGKDGKQGMILQTCKTCGVSVHNDCYELDRAMKKNADFECWACQAVGKTIKVRQRDATSGQRIAVKVTERPTECCLCSVDDGTEFLHAMHPVYDEWDVRGRQILLEATDRKPQRLAWCHTLCALCIGAHTGGCVYGCSSTGQYEGGADEDPPSETESINSDLDEDAQRQHLPDWTNGSVHHFVFCMKLPNKEEPASLRPYTAKIRTQHGLKCYVCGADDRQTCRVALQCCANDEQHEFTEFAGCHTDLADDETCTVPMHVGCAAWGRNAAGERPVIPRVYYFPGKQDVNHVYAETVTSLYCQAHARDVDRFMSKGMKVTESSDGSRTLGDGQRRSAAAAILDEEERAVAATQDRRSFRNSVQARPRGMAAAVLRKAKMSERHASASSSTSDAGQKRRVKAPPEAPPAQAKKPRGLSDGGKAADESKPKSLPQKKKTNKNVPAASVATAGVAGKKPTIKMDLDAPALFDPLGSSAVISGGSTIYEIMVEDLVKHVKSIPKFNRDKMVKVRLERRRYFERRLGFTVQLFNDIWTEVTTAADEVLSPVASRKPPPA
jgi:hypothetical protein